MPKIPFWVFIVLALLYCSAARVDIMDIDASQYAEMSREMKESNDYLHLYDRGKDYLDKPPFLFWASSISMKVFGVNNFGYKFPSILFALFALYATYRLGRLLYGEATGRMAALVLGVSQGMFLMTNDVRTDTILMSWTITAIWMLKEWDISRKKNYFFGGCAAIAFGMMTKGPIALLVPLFCFIPEWALKREWKKFFQPIFLAGLVLIAVLLIPMSLGLYQQFDLHPEKIMDGKTGTSGLRFFFWTQSFGRITGENTWDNGAPFSFLFENMLWSFLPWIILFTAALVQAVYRAARQKFRLRKEQEAISWGGFLISYVALGSSHYQLPHYIFIVFPLASILVAAYLSRLIEQKQSIGYRILYPTQTVISGLLLIAAAATFVFVFEGGVWTYAVWAAGVVLWIWLLLRKDMTSKILWLPVAAMIVANVFMTNHFYYRLLHYQAGSRVGRYILQKNIAANSIDIYKADDPLNALSFYARRTIPREDTVLEAKAGSFVITSKAGVDELRTKGKSFEVETQGPFYKASELTPEFLNPATRDSAVKHYYLLRMR